MDKKINKVVQDMSRVVARLERAQTRPARPTRGAAQFPVAGQAPFGVPTLAQKPGVHIVKHREFVRDITSVGAAFNLRLSEYVNPGNPLIFPWLSSVAIQFERYRFRKCRFWFRSSSGTSVGATNTALGVVVIAADYDALDFAFQNKQQMESYQGAVSTVPSASVAFDLDCKLAHQTGRNLFVLGGAPPAQSDLRLYHAAALSIASSGQQAVSTLGEIWVEYEVELYTPKVPSIIGENIPAFRMAVTPASGGSALNATTLSGRTTANIAINHLAGQITIFTPGRYLLLYELDVATGVTAAVAWTVVSGGNFIAYGNSHLSATSTQYAAWCEVQVTDVTDGCVLQLGSITFSGAVTYGQLVATQMPSNLVAV